MVPSKMAFSLNKERRPEAAIHLPPPLCLNRQLEGLKFLRNNAKRISQNEHQGSVCNPHLSGPAASFIVAGANDFKIDNICSVVMDTIGVNSC